MKAKTEDKVAIVAFMVALKEQRKAEEEMCEGCVEEHKCCPNVGFCYNEGSVLVKDKEGLAIARSAYAEGKDFPVAGYRTCSGKGEYLVENGVLYFEGYRNSFLGGCDVFHPVKSQNWMCVESSCPERGVW